ncbi:MAG: TIM barrel protein, partial [Gemmatimonadota bacterium]|nr:TIM barrel protein [Gemmatimonadota bacterium]
MPQREFNLKYAPHYGHFSNSAGDDYLDQLKYAADQGFTAWEDNGMPKRDIGMQEKIAAEMTRLNLEMGVFVATGSFSDVTFAGDDEDAKLAVLKDIKAAIEVAKRVNAKWCTVVPGLYDLKLAWDYQTANVIELLKRCCDILEESGLVMVLEPLNRLTNHPRVYLAGSPQAYLVCQAVNHPCCKILF